MTRLRPFFLIVDIGFILYWAITLLGIIPSENLFQDYANPLLVAWNWSFLPLDLLISATGIASLALYARQRALWAPLALISLTFTFVSGLQAIAFWTIRGDFDLAWWAPNLFLMIYPLFFIPGLLRQKIG